MGALTGIRVLITRPKAQAENLAQRFIEQGAEPLLFPCLDIHASITEDIKTICIPWRDWQWLLFISANAVTHSQILFQQPLPATIKLAAMGPSTKAALEKAGLPCHLMAPAPFNTHALLTLAEFQDCHGVQMGIVKGQGGRQQLEETLRARGAHVLPVACYERRRPAGFLPKNTLAQVNMLVCTSRESLQNLLNMVHSAEQDNLRHKPLLVISERVAHAARHEGFQHIIVSQKACDEAMVKAAIEWQRGNS